MEEITKIQNVSAATKNAITRKSAQTLPNHPSEAGMSAEEIKRRFYQPILDAANSALAEIDRVVNEANKALGQVDGNLQTFIDTNTITEAYKLNLDNSNWKLNSETNLYEITIPSETHGIANYKDVGVDMYLLDNNNKYISVNQYEVLPNADVRCFHETNSAGFVSIYIKREGFIVGASTTDINHVIGLAKVGKTNNFDDLDNLPNLEQIDINEKMISKIIAGEQKVGEATHSDKADNATYASSSGSTDFASRSDNANRADCDQYGVNINNGYCKQTGNYPNIKAGKAGVADTAKADENGLNINDNYAKQNGSYPNMNVGNATRATSSGTADNATKAQKDANGANIHETYAKQNGDYPNMSVGTSKNATNCTNASTAVNSKNAEYATKDNLGRTIKDTYATGCVIEESSITIQLRVSNYTDPSTSQTFDLFNDAPTPFTMNVVTIRKIGSNTKRILHGNLIKQIKVGSNRCDYKYLYLNLPENIESPSHVLLVSEEYSDGNKPNYADRTETINIGGTVFTRYNIFDEKYDFNNNHYISIQMIY